VPPHVLCRGEAEPEALEGESAALADDEVVELLDIEQLPGRPDLDGQRHVGRRGRRVAGGMVMHRDEGGRLLAHRVTEDFTFPS
jgi:hypothetical protein